MAKYQLLGVVDDVTTCYACGKTNLKKTVAMALPGQETKYYGCDCAARILTLQDKGKGPKWTTKAVEMVARQEAASRRNWGFLDLYFPNREKVKAMAEADGVHFIYFDNTYQYDCRTLDYMKRIAVYDEATGKATFK